MVKINFFIDAQRPEHVDFHLKQLNARYQKIADELQNVDVNLWGYQQDQVVLLQLQRVKKFYTQGNKVLVRMDQHDYMVKKRLYQLAAILPHHFIQISRSEIVNFDLVDHLTLSHAGMIKLIFS